MAGALVAVLVPAVALGQLARPAGGPRTGTLKICKVAGFNIPVGTDFTFTYTAAGGASGTVTVPAGPAPGGYCVVVGTFDVGAYTVTETVPTGDTVTSISPVPGGGSTNIAQAKYSGDLRLNQVSEITYTDADVPQGDSTGYLEICKQLQSSSGSPPSTFDFTVDGQTVAVPPGACSPAIEVVAGSVTVTEASYQDYVLASCSTIPASALQSCNTSGLTATVTVPAGTIPQETILTVTNAPVAQNLWFTNYLGNSIGEVTTSGVVTIYNSPTIDGPWDITLGPNGNMWFTNNSGNSIGEITPSGTVSNFTATSIDRPFGITTGPNGNLWFTNFGNSSIGEITTSGVVSNFTATAIDDPFGITSGPNGNIWWTSDTGSTNSIGEMTTAGSVVATDNFTGYTAQDAEAQFMTVDQSGNLWWANPTNDNYSYQGTVDEYTTNGQLQYYESSDIVEPWEIAVDSHGNVWFTSHGNDYLGEVESNGTLLTYTNADVVDPFGITIDSAGNVWYDNFENNSVGELTTGGTFAEYTNSGIDGPGGMATGP